MPKKTHEIRDPIHVFVRLNTDERALLNSRPFQRLRDIHQLALTYLLYPGATHKRFEHSLGVMELATRVFDVVTNKDNVSRRIRKLLPEIGTKAKRTHWRATLRMAALCHDLGHLPFSHTAEELLPEGWHHERLTEEIILDSEMKAFWDRMNIEGKVIAKLAVGPKKSRWREEFTTWERILSEIIVGDALGVDRIDYLLRDSLHTGVAYGRFDHHRLVDTLRILPPAKSDPSEGPTEPELGMQRGGIHTAEALLLARYFMHTQVYMHHVRRIYDEHLKDFLKEWLPGGTFQTDIDKHLSTTDTDVITALREADADSNAPGHDAAMRIIRHKHFKCFFEPQPGEEAFEPGLKVYRAAKNKFGTVNVKRSWEPPKSPQSPTGPSFPVQMDEIEKQSYPSTSCSELIENLPVAKVDFVYIIPEKKSEAQKWLLKNRRKIIALTGERP